MLNSDKKAETEIKTELPRPLTAQEKQLIDSGNAFSYQIFKQVTAGEDAKNVIISPLSISMALGMALNGAAGETRTAMKEVLGYSALEIQQINESYKSLIELLVNLDPKVTMEIANSVWSAEGFNILPSFKTDVKEYFNATSQTLNFNDLAAADVINNWVEKRTHGMIDKIVSKGSLADFVALLINAVYFKGNWLYEFNPEDTQDEIFTLADGSTIQTKMMNQKTDLQYYRSNEVVMADLPYGNSLYRMTVLMPASDTTGLAGFIQQNLTEANMQQWLAGLQETGGVKVKLPKFSMKYKKKLNRILIDMGMGIAFSSLADFSNLSDTGAEISEVKHKAAITVDEEGTEAAAVTSVGFGIVSANPIGPHIYLDRPFILLIRENVSGTILFMGQVFNPSK